MTKTGLNFNKLKFTFLVLAFAATLGIVSYGYHVYSLFRDWQFNMPQPQLEKLARDLLVYHVKEGHFPTTFIEIDNLIWHTKPNPNYGSEGRQARAELLLLLHESGQPDLRDLGITDWAAASLCFILLSCLFIRMVSQMDRQSDG
jgi:hypothetical protein